MSTAVFEQNEPAILADVCAILAGKTKIRKQLRLVAVYERSTGQLVAEVLRTTKGPVVVHRVAAIQTDLGRSAEVVSESGRPAHVDIREFRREHGIAPLTGEPDQEFPIKGKSAVYLVFGWNFIARTYPDDALVFRQ
ncbi:MAG: hypothetical protein ACLP3C_26005 [Mycobacterium sp.]|uniref:hypothetical protein n=1 Tax=Mycobacterium sp. TaxID=1785 RepID=UPI003F9942AA